MMRAVRFHDYNGLSGVRIDQIPTPSVDPGALLVRVHAAGVNPFDRYAVEGYVNAFVSFTLPAVLGRDFSGVVEAVGAEVTGFMVGDAVFGQAAADAEGTFADYVSIPVDRAAKKPETISHIDAASLPNVLMAAWDGLFSTARGLDLQPGQTILINGAAGGIGGVATQLARWRGARVIGTASAGNLDLVRDLGAEPRDYAASDWLDGLGEIDGVLDSADGSNADLICERLRPGDRYVALRGLPSADFAERWAAKGIVCRVASGPDSAGAWPDMAKVVAQGPVRPVVTATYPLEQFGDALAALGSGHARGKTVLIMKDSQDCP
ncbi:MAG TPA: NADP-dependent oxidoreductase [Rhizorhapis sp.]